MAPSRETLPQTRRQTAKARSSREMKKRETRVLLAHVGNLGVEDVDIDIRRCQHDILEVFREPAVANGDLARGLQCQPVVHRVRDYRDFLDMRIAATVLEQPLQGVARVIRAFAIIAIGQQTAARRPCHQYRVLCAPESCTIWAKRKTASSKWLLNPWMKTRTLRSGVFRTALLNQFSAVGRSTSSAMIVAKSVAGFGGCIRGHATSPTLRTLLGGIDTVILAKAGTGAPLAAEHFAGVFGAASHGRNQHLDPLADHEAATGCNTPVGRLAHTVSKAVNRVATARASRTRRARLRRMEKTADPHLIWTHARFQGVRSPKPSGWSSPFSRIGVGTVLSAYAGESAATY